MSKADAAALFSDPVVMENGIRIDDFNVAGETAIVGMSFDDGLSAVYIDIADFGCFVAIERGLIALYGQPLERDMVLDARYMRWVDAENDNEITYYHDKSCSLVYEPIEVIEGL